tara:strand:+ start:2676 stop:3602 length:927 start_codon:yes stop_codon:yes gene_type:complete
MKYLYFLIFIFFSVFSGIADVKAAAMAGGVGAPLHKSVKIGTIQPGLNTAVDERLEVFRGYLNQVKGDLPEADPNVAIAFIYLRKNNGQMDYILIPMTFISGWSLEKKRGSGLGIKAGWNEAPLRKILRAAAGGEEEGGGGTDLNQFAANYKFVSDFYPGGTNPAKLSAYRDTFREFVDHPRREGVMPMGDDWLGFKTEFEDLFPAPRENIGRFSAKFCHTEYAILNALSLVVKDKIDEINKRNDAGNKKYNAYGVAMLSYLPSCVTCQRLIRREFETMYFFKKNLNAEEKGDIENNYSIKVNSIERP